MTSPEESTKGMRIQHARTGLKLEKRLYLAAQKRATIRNQSFAAYVIDLIAIDLAGAPGTEDIPDVRRIIGHQDPTAAQLSAAHLMRKRDADLAHQAKQSELPKDHPMKGAREMKGRVG
jgi:hypothetical protein